MAHFQTSCIEGFDMIIIAGSATFFSQITTFPTAEQELSLEITLLFNPINH